MTNGYKFSQPHKNDVIWWRFTNDTIRFINNAWNQIFWSVCNKANKSDLLKVHLCMLLMFDQITDGLDVFLTE